METLKVISLYSGAGGLDYGFEAAGFKTSACVEMDPTCVETLRRNRSWPVISQRIEDVSTKSILEIANMKRGEASVLIGGPPCQPFSKAGFWHSGKTKRLDDGRAATLSEYFRVVREALPTAFLLENVEGLAYEGKDEGLQHIYQQVERIKRSTKVSYNLATATLNAADFGAPQLRRRFFVVGWRGRQQFAFPVPTHGGERQPFRTAWDAIGGLQPPSHEDLKVRGRWADLLPSIPEGQNYLAFANREGEKALFGWRTRYWSFLLKLAKHLPSWTIQAQPGPAIGPFHWDNRRLSMRELCRLQTFPDDVFVVGNRTQVQRQIGNAVPSLLGEVIARAIGRQLMGRRSRTAVKLAVNAHDEDRPAPEPTAPVPASFDHLWRQYPTHPGTGRGPGALTRGHSAL